MVKIRLLCPIASLHAEVDGSSDIFGTHDIIDNVEKKLYNDFGIVCTIHIDPIVTDDETVTSMRMMINDIVKQTDSSWDIHDFRMVSGATHTNLIFDVVIPFECKLGNEQIIEIINKKVKNTLGDSYFVVLTIDKG